MFSGKEAEKRRTEMRYKRLRWDSGRGGIVEGMLRKVV